MITFILKDPSAKESTLIYLTYYFNGRRLKMSTGEKILPVHWNKVKHRPRSTAPFAESLTTLLDRLEVAAKEAHLSLKSCQRTITPHLLAQVIERDINRQGKRETLGEFFQRFIDDPTNYKNGAYHAALKLFQDYTGAKDFEDINLDKYQKYLESHDYAASYVGKSIAIVQEVMSAAHGQGITKVAADRGHKKPNGDTETIFLTENELLYIYGVELPPHLDRVRNRFIIGAFSGLRFSDSAKITHDSIRQGLIFDKNIKTGANVVVPIHWTIEQIMAAHPGGLPPSISNQNTNRYLKKIGKLASINELVVVNKTKGGKVVTETRPKYELISSHTARRSAVTNMVLAGIPTQAIMAISGHSTQGSFQKYVKMSGQESAISIQNHAFFQK